MTSPSNEASSTPGRRWDEEFIHRRVLGLATGVVAAGCCRGLLHLFALLT